ncbi:MAG: hypothetical protein ABFD80_09455, partial [Acidobacteriota bacterium]
MKRHFFIIFGAVFFLALCFVGLRHSMATQDVINVMADTAPYMPNEVLVKFRTATPEAAILENIDAVQGLVITHRGEHVSSGGWAENKSAFRSFLANPDIFHIKVPATIGTEKAIAELRLNPSVEFAEKNYSGYCASTPNDTYYDPSQWALENSRYQNDADIDASAAWDITTGSADVTM